MREIQFYPRPVGGTEFAFVGDYKIVRFPDGDVLVQRVHHGMPAERGAIFVDLDDALDYIGVEYPRRIIGA